MPAADVINLARGNRRVYDIPRHDVSTEKVNAVALRVYDDTKLKISDRIRRFMP